MSDKIYEMITDRMIELMEKGEIPWRRPWNGETMPMNLISKKPYRGINIFFLNCYAAAEGFGPYWLSFKQAKEKGGTVRKGEKGIPVIFWKLYEKDKETGELWPVLRYYTVFNLSQCHGIEAPPAAEAEPLEFSPVEAAERIIEAMPSPPAIEHTEQARAFYMPGKDKVHMPDRELFKSIPEYYSTLFHELSHSTGHKSRLNRDTDHWSHSFGSADYSKEELIAEMGAAFLCAHSRIETATIENSAAYIQGWIKQFKDKPKMLILAAAAAQKSTDWILNRKFNE